LTAEKCLKSSIAGDPNNPKSAMLKNQYLSNTVKPATKVVVNSESDENENLSDEDNSVQKQTRKVSNHKINSDNSSRKIETDADMDGVNIRSYVNIDEESNDSLDSTSTTIVVSNLMSSTPRTNNRIKSNSNLLSPNTRREKCSRKKSKDTATIIIPSILETVEPSYRFIVSDSKIQNFIKEGKMIENDDIVNAYNPTEIDEIINDEFILGTHYYLVKWKKWSRGFNTWERYGTLYKSQQLLLKYIKNKKTDKYANNCKRDVSGIQLMLSRKTISYLFELFRTESGLCLPTILPEDVSGLFNSLDNGAEHVQSQRKKSFIMFLTTISLGYFRQRQLTNLRQWEIDINVVTRGHKIKVENNMDLEGPPNFFVYVTKYVPQPTIIIPDDPPIGCTCKKNCQSSEECCNEISGYSAVYDVNKNIMVAPGYPVFECNSKCKCTTSCTNRVVQLGSKVNVCIYKTRKYGWGIKSTQNIKKGQFVARYIGEIITVEESEQRLNNGSSRMDYMWNLDFDDSQNYKYIIDGTHYANFTYFINHSCNANLNVYAVWINCLDRNLPQLALFASRDISAGEQLTTNYFSRCTNKNTLKKSGIKCKCDMKNCKGYFF